ncbi:MAG: hypothetical protein JJT75_01000 [Opitutales bacterium]|nr:hypothetical protein [Opitutales bacterium]MCH8540412.1 hypothetical protein [Opitutales bacterium]
MKHFLYTLSLLLLSLSFLSGQGRMETTASAPDGNGDAAMDAIRSVFDTESDYFDPEEGIFHWKGRTFSVGNSRVFRSRFQRYLSLTGTDLEEHREYQDIIQKVDHLLSPAVIRQARDINDNVDQAWVLLNEASSYSVDGRNSRVLARRIYNTWQLRDELRQSQRISRRIAGNIGRQRQDILRDLILNEMRARGSGLGTQTTDDDDELDELTSQVQRQAFMQADLAEFEGELGTEQIRAMALGEQAKLEFQTLIASFLTQRRFQHALIAINFYQVLFRASAQDVEIQSEDLDALLPGADMAYSMEILEAIANEAIVEVDESMRAVEASYANGDRILAMERLQETFHLGEYLPSVMLFDYEKRQNILHISRNMRQAQRLADAKDYDGVEEIVFDLRERADDFPASEVLANINTARRASNFHLARAREHFLRGDRDGANDEMEQAAEIWPLNPQIDDALAEVRDSSDFVLQLAKEFDQSLEENRYRAIQAKADQFGAAFHADPDRSGKLREIVTKMTHLDIALQQSERMLAQNNPYAAYEMLLEAREIYDEDNQLNRMLVDVTPQVSNFVQAIRRAQEKEEQGRYHQSLAWYLQVEKIYPASQTAQSAISRVSRKLMEDLQPTEIGPADEEI